MDMDMEGWVVLLRDTGAWKAEAQARLATRSVAIIAATGAGGVKQMRLLLDPS